MKTEKKKTTLNQSENKKDMPLFSIIILTYQQRHLLEDCIDSILEQDYPNIELIICDDCSVDFEVDEVRDYIEEKKNKNLSNVIIYQQPKNVGTVLNAQKGVELSSGKYFKLHAGDDLLYNETILSHVMETFRDHTIEIIAGRSIACQQNGEMTEHYYPSTEAVESMIHADADKQFQLIGGQSWGEFVNAPAVFWRRSLFDQVGGFDLRYKYTEDWPMWLKITKAGHRIHMMNEVFTIYRYGGISNDVSTLNLTIGKTHYEECIQMFQEEILPIYLSSNDKMKLIRTRHCIRCLQIRKDVEGIWTNWNTFQKLCWKMKNADFLFLSWLYRKTKHGIQMNKKICLQLMAVCAILFYFQVDIWPGVSCGALWSWFFVAVLIWCMGKVAIEVAVKLLSKVLNKRRAN